MAADLGISRNTVNAVYDQLKAEGFLQSRAGKGVFVHEDIATVAKPAGRGLERPIRTTADLPPLPVPAPTNIRTAEDANLPFQPGLPDLDAFPIRSWNRILHHQESRRALRGYDSIQGYLPLRRAIADYLRTSRGCVVKSIRSSSPTVPSRPCHSLPMYSCKPATGYSAKTPATAAPVMHSAATTIHWCRCH